MKRFISLRTALISIVVIGGILFVWNVRKLQFEYYVWHLSSEAVTDREYYAAKIISMGDDAVPLLVSKLDHQFIFETDYVVFCLEQITKADVTYQLGHSSLTSDIIPFWKQWWNKHQHEYK